MKCSWGTRSWFVAAVLAVIGSTAGGSDALAITCTQAEQIYGAGTQALITAYPECNTKSTTNSPSTAVTTRAVQQASVNLQTTIIGDQIRIAQGLGASNPLNPQVSMRPGKLGISAGNWMRGVNVWGSLAWSSVEDTSVAMPFDGTVVAGAMGADFEVRHNVIVGAAAVIEQTNVDTTFNVGTQDSLGVTGAAYAAVEIRPFSLEAIVGYGHLDHDLQRTDPADGVTQITGDTTGSRFFAQVRANYFHEYGKVKLNPFFGVTYSRETIDGFTESNGAVTADTSFELGQAHVGGEIAYAAGWASPFIRARWEYDFERTDTTVAPTQVAPTNDRDGLVVGAGYYIDLGPDLRAIAEATTTLLREDYTEYTLRARLKLRF